uniref:Uncharacterized protein n=1 Tax=Arundo donax TaxID=35708 RepID=A0A0A9DFW6_ARUDO
MDLHTIYDISAESKGIFDGLYLKIWIIDVNNNVKSVVMFLILFYIFIMILQVDILQTSF